MLKGMEMIGTKVVDLSCTASRTEMLLCTSDNLRIILIDYFILISFLFYFQTTFASPSDHIDLVCSLLYSRVTVFTHLHLHNSSST